MRSFPIFALVVFCMVCLTQTGCKLFQQEADELYGSSMLQPADTEEDNIWSPKNHHRDRSFSATGIDPQAREIERRLGY